MTFKQPPAIASRCLVSLSGPDEGLLGELFEEYQHRQSPWWYRRQVAIAIVVGFVHPAHAADHERSMRVATHASTAGHPDGSA